MLWIYLFSKILMSGTLSRQNPFNPTCAKPHPKIHPNVVRKVSNLPQASRDSSSLPRRRRMTGPCRNHCMTSWFKIVIIHDHSSLHAPWMLRLCIWQLLIRPLSEWPESKRWHTVSSSRLLLQTPDLWTFPIQDLQNQPDVKMTSTGFQDGHGQNLQQFHQGYARPQIKLNKSLQKLGLTNRLNKWKVLWAHDQKNPNRLGWHEQQHANEDSHGCVQTRPGEPFHLTSHSKLDAQCWVGRRVVLLSMGHWHLCGLTNTASSLAWPFNPFSLYQSLHAGFRARRM